MTAGRPAPMVNLSCRVPRSLVERIARLVAGTGFQRCDVVRRMLDLGATAMEQEASNNNAEGQS